MSYRCGTNGLRSIGIPDGPPRFICDGCGVTYEVRGRGAGGNVPPAWYFDGKAPPRWRKRVVEGVRDDRCPECKEGM